MTGDARIGLEVHVYLRTDAKLFCSCSADVQAAKAANTQVCPTCTGQPGAKPMAPNAEAVAQAVDVVRALACTVQARSRFQRKHYFYPDLPSNYQRTSEPIGVDGNLAGVGIWEAHLEEDPGAFDPASGLVDYNRAGVPLLEIVTAPEIRDPEHARRFLQELRLVLAYLDAWREEAGVKADVNVSVAGGPRAEVKNVNSLRNVEQAVACELQRQREALERGEKLVQETRHFDEDTGRTTRLRVKETAADYRYLVDPDLLPVDVAAVARERSREALPLERRARLAELAGVAPEEASPLFTDRALVDAFEEVAAKVTPRQAFDFFLVEVRHELEYRKTTWSGAGLAADEVADLLAAAEQGKITGHVVTRLLRHGLNQGSFRSELEKELSAGVDDAGLNDVAREVLVENPQAVENYKAGKTTVLNFLVGQLMKKTLGRAAPDAAREAVERALAHSED